MRWVSCLRAATARINTASNNRPVWAEPTIPAGDSSSKKEGTTGTAPNPVSAMPQSMASALFSTSTARTAIPCRRMARSRPGSLQPKGRSWSAPPADCSSIADETPSLESIWFHAVTSRSCPLPLTYVEPHLSVSSQILYPASLHRPRGGIHPHE